MQQSSIPPLVDPYRPSKDYPQFSRWQPQRFSANPGSPQAGTLSPLSQFNPGWPKPASSASSSSSQGSTAVPWRSSHWPGTPYPSSPSQSQSVRHNRGRSEPPADSHSQDWSWPNQWFLKPPGAFRWPIDSSPSPPPPTSPDFSLALTQTLSRHDSSATISSTHSRLSATPLESALLATGRPPQQWRNDFKMPRTGLAAIMPRKKRSLAYPGRHSSRTVLSPYLRYNGPDTPVYWDLQYLPSTVLFRDLPRPPAQGDFTRFVCEPPLRLMRIYHSRLPWYVDAQTGINPVGVTFADLFNAVYTNLQQQIVDADFYNDELDDDARKRITDAYRKRCGNDAAEAAKGIRRVDFLMGRVVFEGLVKGKEGLWEMKTAKPLPATPQP